MLALSGAAWPPVLFPPCSAACTCSSICRSACAGTRTAGHASGSIWATDVPGWITAAGTALLAIFAILTTIYAVRAFRKQSQEVTDQTEMLNVQAEQLEEQRKVNEDQIKVLKLQAKELEESIDERKREREQRHRDQAFRVFITQERKRTAPLPYPEQPDVEPFVHATVVNTSDQPIYDAELRWHIGTAGHPEQPNPEPLGTVMPGEDKAVTRMRTFPYGVDMNISGAVVRFTDANGVRWLRRPDGYLNEFP
jgi:hypothetical protein